MRKLPIVLVSLIAIVVTGARAQERSSVIRLDPGLDDIVPPNVKVEKLAGDFKRLEGPVWIRKGGYLIFSDLDANVIYKWNPADGKVSTFLENSGWTDPSRLGLPSNAQSTLPPRGPGAATSSNGITVDPQGRIVYCARGDLQIVRLEADGRRTVLVGEFDGKPLNRPNDLVYKKDGALYFTDPFPGDAVRNWKESMGPIPAGRVFLLKDGKLQLLAAATDIRQPNGLAFTPDEKHLYIVDAGEQKTIRRYEVQRDGTIAKGQVLIDMRTDSAPGGPDGMKVDQKGNVYTEGPGGLWIISPAGKHLGTLPIPDVVPESVSNLAFGDDDGKTLYLTGDTGLYRVRLKIAGLRP